MKTVKIRSNWNVEFLETRRVLSADPVSCIDSLVSPVDNSQPSICVDDTGSVGGSTGDGSFEDGFTIDENGNYVDADGNIFEVDSSIFESGVPFDGGHDYGYAVDENGEPLLTTMLVDPLYNYYFDEDGNMVEYNFAEGEIQPNWRTLIDTDGEVILEKDDLGEIAEFGITSVVDDAETLSEGEVMITTDAEIDLGEIAQSGAPAPEARAVDTNTKATTLATTFASLFSSLKINASLSPVVIISADPLESDQLPVLE